MKQGHSLIELAQELARREAAKRDFVADTRRLNFWQQPLPEGSSRIQLHLEGQGDFALNRHCHRQVRRHLDIPAKYYDRMVEQAPALAVETLNTLSVISYQLSVISSFPLITDNCSLFTDTNQPVPPPQKRN